MMDMEEVADGAEKELAIETKLSEMEDKWRNERFRFVEWRGRGVHVFVGITVILEELEEVRVLGGRADTQGSKPSSTLPWLPVPVMSYAVVVVVVVVGILVVRYKPHIQE